MISIEIAFHEPAFPFQILRIVPIIDGKWNMKIDSLKNLLLSIDDFFLSHFKAIPLHKILDAHSASLIEFANNQEDSC